MGSAGDLQETPSGSEVGTTTHSKSLARVVLSQVNENRHSKDFIYPYFRPMPLMIARMCINPPAMSPTVAIGNAHYGVLDCSTVRCQHDGSHSRWCDVM
eukprot:scaffold636772_cov15-Prasinocladus_malaysianus.AAC.1